MLLCKAGNNDVLLCGIITQFFSRLPHFIAAARSKVQVAAL
jgi:hypothetical protein